MADHARATIESLFTNGNHGIGKYQVAIEMRAVLESVGVKNVLAKSKGSSNPHSVVKATFAALAKMRDARTVAQMRGVDMDVVFNG